MHCCRCRNRRRRWNDYWLADLAGSLGSCRYYLPMNLLLVSIVSVLCLLVIWFSAVALTLFIEFLLGLTE
jgi:hypothetical protein